MIWTIALLSALLLPSPADRPATGETAPHAVRAAIDAPPLVTSVAAIEEDFDRPLREEGLPDRSREREDEEEGAGDDGDSVQAGFALPTFDRPQPAVGAVAVSNRWYLGLGPEVRAPYLRC